MTTDLNTTQEHERLTLASFLPNDRLFANKHVEGTNIYKSVDALANEFRRFMNLGWESLKEHDVNTTQKFIDEWEGAVGIPDDCFDGTGSLLERRNAVLVKLQADGTQTLGDFQDLLTQLGFTNGVDYILEPGRKLSAFPLELPFSFGGQHVLILRLPLSLNLNGFPLTFPFPLGGNPVGFIECFIRKLKPANVELQVIFDL